jgi:gamma-glutamylcyclotransferase (GGCT)/AIG2-like uncharacterized protein YtfP
VSTPPASSLGSSVESHAAQTVLQVFVYGTLKPGEENHDRYCGEKVVAAYDAYTLGDLYDLPMGYPALTPGDRPAYGVLLAFDDPAVLKTLDDLEEYDPDRPAHENEYERQEQDIFNLDGTLLTRAWVYWMPRDRALQFGGVLLPNGRWSASPA